MPANSEKWTWVVFGLWLALTLGGGMLMFPNGATLDQFATHGPAWNVMAAGLFLLIVSNAQGWSNTGFNPPRMGLALRLSWLPLALLALLAAIAVASGLPSTGTLLMTLVNCLFVSLSEECMFRGQLLRHFARRWHLWGTAIAVSACFGAVHSLNAILTGDLPAALVQSAVAFMLGFYFHALRLRTGSLVGPILLHALWDFVLFTFYLSVNGQGITASPAPDGGPGAVLIPLAFGLPLLLMAIYMMRRMPERSLAA